MKPTRIVLADFFYAAGLAHGNLNLLGEIEDIHE